MLQVSSLFHAGKTLGFVAAYTIFCTILTVIMAFTRDMPFKPILSIIIVSSLSIVGYLLRRWLA